jgi:C1A family cysteine protease
MQAFVAREGLHFKVAKNWVTDYLESGGDIADVTGYVPQSTLGAQYVNLPVAKSLPAAFDWRTELPNGLNPVRDQGYCGSCWAFSVAGVVEALVRIENPQAKINLSEQTMVSCDNDQYGCNGGFFHAFDYVQSPGLPDEAQFPYEAEDLSCKKGLESVQKIADWAYIGDGENSPTVEQVKTAIYEYGPVAVDVNGSFSSYAGGVYDDCYYSGTNHMVVLVGWNDAEGGYWIMRNSWGDEWGEEGYMRIRYKSKSGKRCNNIAETAAFAVLTQVIVD